MNTEAAQCYSAVSSKPGPARAQKGNERDQSVGVDFRIRARTRARVLQMGFWKADVQAAGGRGMSAARPKAQDRRCFSNGGGQTIRLAWLPWSVSIHRKGIAIEALAYGDLLDGPAP